MPEVKGTLLRSSFLGNPEEPGYSVEWLGGALTLEEDSEVSIGHLAVP